MRRFMLVATMSAVMTLPAWGQEAPAFARSSSPFQDEYELTLGRPVQVRVDIVGVRVDTLTVTPAAEVEAGKEVRTEFALSGDNSASDRATVTAVLLLEDADGHGLERVTLDSFRVRGERSFDERQTLRVPGEALAGAAKIYVLLEVEF